MRDVTAVESDYYYNWAEGIAMTIFECDGYNKFDVNNNKILKWLWLFHLVSIPTWSLQISDIN